MLLARKLVVSLGRKDMVFNPKKGRFYSKRSRRLLVSIKDPFIKEINYGVQMREKEKLKQLLDVLKSFIRAAAENSTFEFFQERGDAALSFQNSSMNQSSLNNSASPQDESAIGNVSREDLEERKGPIAGVLAPNLSEDAAHRLRQ